MINETHKQWFERNKEDFAKGDIGEAIVKEYLEDVLHCTVTDVSQEPKYQQMDIDFLVDRDSFSEQRTVEVKNDYKLAETGNFFCEYDTYKCGVRYRGWMNKSKADWLFIIQLEGRKIYVLNFNRLKGYCDSHKGLIRQFYNYKEDAYTQAVLLPVWKARENKILIKEIDLSPWLEERSCLSTLA